MDTPFSFIQTDKKPRPFFGVVLFFFLMTGGAARAQDRTTLLALDSTPTMESIGIVASYLGDDNDNASAHVEYRTIGDPAYQTGHSLVRLSGKRWAGSVLFINPGTDYEIRVVVIDPDNDDPASLEANVRTRDNAPPGPLPSGVTYWIDAGQGLDTNPGTAEFPFRTIQAGANAAQPGDTVRVRAGVYRERVTPPRGGIQEAPIWFLADGPGAILDGSDPALTTGAYWVRASSKLYWTPFSGSAYYAAVDDTRIYDYQTLADLQAENGNIGVTGAIQGGFFVDTVNSRLYLITPDHTSPADHQIHVAIKSAAFFLDGISDVVLEGFQMRYFGGDAVVLRETARTWVRWNTIHHTGSAVQIYNDGASENVVERNSYRDTSVYQWPWDSVKGHTAEQSAISVNHGHGNVIRWNTIEGSFNGIYTGIWEVANEEIARDTDVYENKLDWHGDDGLELEWDQRNVRVWENVILNGRNAISISPIQTGPVFLVRNVVADYSWHALKINNGTPGYVFIYHTTARPMPGSQYPDAQAFSPPLPFGNVTTRNNIWEANRYVIEYMPGETLGGVSLDVDDLFTHDTSGANRFVKWLDVRYSDIDDLKASNTIEQNGYEVEPVYENPGDGDFTLVEGHAMIDAGVALSGINLDSYTGNAPDLGAFERGGIVPGPDPEEGDILRAGAASNLPGSPDARFRNVRLPWTDPDEVLSNPGLPRNLFYLLEPSPGMIVVTRDGDSIRVGLLSTSIP